MSTVLDPVCERIMQEVRRRAGKLHPSRRSTAPATWQPKHGVFHVYQGEHVRNGVYDCPGNPPAVGWTLEAIIACIVKPNDNDTTPVDTYKNRFAAEAIKSITAPNMWYTFGGLAVDANIGQVEDYTAEDGSASGAIVRVSIAYRTAENDPYTVRC